MPTLMGYITCVRPSHMLVCMLFYCPRRAVCLPVAAHHAYTARADYGRWLTHPWFHPLLQPLKSYGVSSLWGSRYWPPAAFLLLAL